MTAADSMKAVWTPCAPASITASWITDTPLAYYHVNHRQRSSIEPPSPRPGCEVCHVSRPSSQSKSDWLATSLMMPRHSLQPPGAIPFPYRQRCLGTAVAILETVEVWHFICGASSLANRCSQKVKKNQDDLKELCENIMEIIRFVQVQLTTHDDTAALKFKGLCEDLESILQDVLKAVTQLQMKDRGLNSRFKEVMKLGSTADEISLSDKNPRAEVEFLGTQSLHFNLQVMAAIDTNLQVHKGFAAAEQLSKIDVGLTKINADWELSVSDPPALLIMQQHEDLSQQHIFLLHGLGGAGKTRIALKFIQDYHLGLKNIAATKTAGSRVQDALEWLSSQSDEWLLLFDNADDPKINLH
ncbi:hypothetical protein FB451DRAFT_1524420, partial [Mycena latifolia]